MQGLVEIILGGGNVIVELVGNWPPVGVDDAQGGVTGSHIRDDQPDAAHIPHQVEGFTFFDHFLINGIDMLGSS